MRTLLVLCATLAPLLATALDCPAGFKDLELGDSRCYMYSNESKSWTMAFTTCLTSSDGDGNLLSVPDANSFYPQYYQVRAGGADVWTGLLNIPGQYSWADDTEYDHSIDQFIADDAGNELYGYLSGEDGLFRFDDGSIERGFACYVDVSEEPVTTEAPPPPPPCEAGWEQYGETCYLFSTDQEYWPSAGHACHEKDAELISITDSGVLTFLLLTADQSTTYWIGLENQDSTYVWEDGTSADNVVDVLGPYMDAWSEGNDCVALVASHFPEPLEHMNCVTQKNYICYKDVATEDFFVPENLRFWL